MAKKKVGRPRIQFSEKEMDTLKALSSIHCTYKEMAVVMGVSVDTLSDNFSDVIEEGREKGKSSVRRMLWTHGQNGNSIALKYLIHNILHEKLDDGSIAIKVFSDEVSKLTDDQIEQLAVEKLKLKAGSSDK